MTEWTTEAALAHILANTITTDSGCREWQGSRTTDGYGQVAASLYNAFGIRGAHRLAYHLSTGHEFASRNEQILHSCHNRACVNPDHLSIGTARENIAQAVARGTMMRGQDHVRSKLTDHDVMTIRAMISWGYRNVFIARNMDISESTVSQIRTGRIWRHVQAKDIDLSQLSFS